MSVSDHSKLLNGNPAMLEIWSDAIERIEKRLPLAQVQKIVVQEWLWRAIAKRDKLNAKAQKDFLSDEQYAELAALDEMIDTIRNFTTIQEDRMKQGTVSITSSAPGDYSITGQGWDKNVTLKTSGGAVSKWPTTNGNFTSFFQAQPTETVEISCPGYETITVSLDTATKTY